MFSMKSTWKEIKTTKPVDTALGDLLEHIAAGA